MRAMQQTRNAIFVFSDFVLEQQLIHLCAFLLSAVGLCHVNSDIYPAVRTQEKLHVIWTALPLALIRRIAPQ